MYFMSRGPGATFQIEALLQYSDFHEYPVVRGTRGPLDLNNASQMNRTRASRGLPCVVRKGRAERQLLFAPTFPASQLQPSVQMEEGTVVVQESTNRYYCVHLKIIFFDLRTTLDEVEKLEVGNSQRHQPARSLHFRLGRWSLSR